MSWQPCDDPKSGDAAPSEAIEQILIPRARDVGGFEVRRALPAVGKQMVGPFIFLDQMGPAELRAGQGFDVAPHPHIGLATVTYLFAGELVHRDSLGSEMAITPGALNLMSAGSGIVHSERSSAEARAAGGRLFGIQAWAALPKAHEEDAPTFAHHDATQLPRIAGEGKTVRLIMGSLYGARSPAAFPHDCFYAEALLAPGAVLPLDPDYDERAVYIVSGEIDIAGEIYGAGRLIVLRPGDRISLLALSMARLMLLGGEPMDGPRHIWWNFVSSSKDRIAAAKADWKARKFDSVPTDSQGFTAGPD